MKLIILLTLSILSTSCNSQEKKVNTNKKSDSGKVEIESQIGEYVTSIFEDSKGNLWFGTLEKGIARYDGEKLKYFTTKDGLPSDRVTGIIEDSKGIFWLNTGEGVSKYDGKNFTNFLVGDDFNSNVIAKLLIDSKNVFWVGTWNGAFKFDGEAFHPFSVPYPEVDTKINEDTKYWITGISEDAGGNIWFRRDGYGVCKYDGDVYEIYRDKSENIWIGTIRNGVYRYNGEAFKNYNVPISIMGILEDRKGNFWLGGAGGLYRINQSGEVINVTTKGPWK